MTVHERAEKLRAYLASEYGITTMEQFEEAYRQMPALDISIFVKPQGEEKIAENEIKSVHVGGSYNSVGSLAGGRHLG